MADLTVPKSVSIIDMALADGGPAAGTRRIRRMTGYGTPPAPTLADVRLSRRHVRYWG